MPFRIKFTLNNEGAHSLGAFQKEKRAYIKYRAALKYRPTNSFLNNLTHF